MDLVVRSSPVLFVGAFTPVSRTLGTGLGCPVDIRGSLKDPPSYCKDRPSRASEPESPPSISSNNQIRPILHI